ncbi:MAG: permease-like cell division protein FtsX [Candidatus Nomurabacteria bacterium]|jgi:cell division transport system permease protein|nr:permease-like cell division protein FtsX [Candidatus Nomurabacteria bacterium]
MMMAKKEARRPVKMLGGTSQASAKALEPKRRHRFITFMRILKYGFSSFSRNAWLSVASLAVMLVTLLIICLSLVARDVMMGTVADIRDKIDMSIYVKPETSEKDIAKIKTDLQGLSTVKSVKYISPDEAKEEYARENVHDANTSTVLSKAKNNFQGTFNIKIIDIDDTSELENFVKTNTTVKKAISERYKPSFATDRKAAIDNIAHTVSFAEKVGLIAAVVFVAIAALMIFNTIRMSIHNRREEIYMMRLIGADKGFIRGPFVVEAVVTGVVAALFATGIVYSILFTAVDKLESYGVAVQPTLNFMVTFAWLVLLAMIAVGSLIGVVSSVLATHRYLKSQG